MYVCLCHETTCKTVRDAVADGALTCKQVSAKCGAGSDCGRCLRTLKAVIEAHLSESVPVAS